ncbi:MAG TPA: class I SAM-dependent methyltransferase [Steroidobacteraceae bacterium]|nr:class I SAM-dependent methyltransferase [Candidatus Dormibacteraeota bacterium]HYM27945.1 class I SAM-dependent methyltransferase [Steroidobacteraceae bacterium]
MTSAAPSPAAPADEDLLEKNQRFYDLLWSGATLVEPQRFNTWPLVQSLLPSCRHRLEVAPGLRPRLPLAGTQFVDISVPALAKLRACGAQVVQSEVSSLPFPAASFDLVCALDIVEHVDDDEGVLAELARVARGGATVLLSTPLHPAMWTPFDDFVGHRRRYEPDELLAKLARHHLQVERSAVFGMQPRSSRLVDAGMWWLVHHRERAMWWYNRVFMRVALWFQEELRFRPGLLPTAGVDEVFLVCRREDSPATR